MFYKSKASQTKCTASGAMEEIISLVLQGCKSASDLQSNLENLADQPDMLSKSCEEIQQVFRNAKERLDHFIFHPAQVPQQHQLESLQARLRSGYTQQTGIPQKYEASDSEFERTRHPAERSPFDNRRSVSDVLAAGLGGTELERSALSKSIGVKFHADEASDSELPSKLAQWRDDGERWTINVCAPLIGNTEIPPEDGFTWRKYGQKDILGSRFPRAYFKCSHCQARKHVQRLDDDPYSFQVTYRGKHTCPKSSTAPSVSPVAADFTREMTQIITSLPPPTSSVTQSEWLSMDFLGRGVGGGGGSSSRGIVPVNLPMASLGFKKGAFTLSSSSTDRQKYEVFLSGSRPSISIDLSLGDPVSSFTNLLYATLKRIGISVFKREGYQMPGEEIRPCPKNEIEESRFAVVVFSNNIADIKPRLVELDVIMERREMGLLTVFPVFHGVSPFQVRNQAGYFGEAFARLKDDPTVSRKEWERWKAILTEIGDCTVDSPEVVEDPLKSFGGALEEGGKFSGWHVENVEDRCNMKISTKISLEIVNKISLKIFGELIPKSIDSAEFLIGIETQAMKIMELLCLEESSDVRFIGICGMTGIGKTTLAKVIYERASTAFKAWSFISDIGGSESNGLVRLQRKLLLDLQMKVADSFEEHTLIKMLERLLKNKKVLLILDDVRRSEQIAALAGSAEWFGKGSRIILTSRHHYLPPYLCKDSRDFHIYEIKALSDNAALQLFCFKAFNKLYPKEEFKGLTRDILDFAQGLPLALENLGSKFSSLEKSRWESYLIQLKANLDRHIVEKLKINFDELGDFATKAFLDIICFFKGQSKNYVSNTLEYLGYPSENILEDLKDKSLLKFEENKVLVAHDFLTQMGQEIAKCAGLWHTEDIVALLREKEITKPNAIRGILLKFPPRKPGMLCYDAFSSMKKLQLLEINTPEGLIWCDTRKRFIRLKWSGNPQDFSLSNELCVLRWDEYPFESLPHGFKPANLVELKLRRSSIKALRGDVERFNKLKCIDLHCSKELIETPDISDIRNLERLDLSDCSKLSKVHHSIGFLERLRELSLRNCFRLRRLPNTFRLPSLTSLDLCGCSRRKKFPGGVRNLKSLRTLNLNNTAIKALPRSFTRLSSLKDLYISGRYFSEEITFDEFSGCTKLPDKRYRPSGLLTDARSVNLCAWSSGLNSLEKLDLSYRNLGREALPSYFGFWLSLTHLNLSGNRFKEISDGIHQLSNLRHFLLNNCDNLERLPRLPLGLRNLDLGNCPSLERFYKDSNACNSRPCDWIATYFGDYGESYSFLNLHPGSTVWNNHCGHSVRWVAWGFSGLLRQADVPEWFYHRRMGRIPVPADRDYDPLLVNGYALFVSYEVPNPEADLSLDCWLQDEEDGLGVHLGFPARERSPLRRFGVWMYIPSWGNKSSASASLALLNPLNKAKEKENMSLASIEISSKTVEIKKFGARVVCKGDDLNDPGSFTLPSFCRLFGKRDEVPCIEVHGPVKLPIDPSSKSSGDV